MALGSLIVQLAVDLARFRSDMGQAAQISQTRLREIERSTAATVRQISQVGRSIQTAFGVVGIGVGLTSIVFGLKNAAAAAIDFGDEMNKAVAKTGVAGSVFSELAYAAQQNDVQLEQLSQSFKFLQVNLSKAASDGKPAAEVLKALGLTIAELQALRPEQQFELIADRISLLRDPADRARAAVELFGKAGANLLPLFEEGAKGIRALREEAVRTGRSLTEDQIKKLSEADDAVKRLKASWEALARSLTANVAPMLTEFFDNLSGSGPSTIGAAEKRLKEAQNTLKYYETSWPNSLRKQREQAQAEVDAAIRDLNRLQEAQRNALIGPSGPINPRGKRAEVPGFKPAGKTEDATAGLSDITIWQRKIWNLRNEQEAWMAEFDTEFTNSFVREVNGTANSIRSMTMVIEENEEELNQWSAFADEAARNIQSAFADFLFDPFEKGLKGLLVSFIDTIRRMVAEAAAAQILQTFFGFVGGAIGGASGGGGATFGGVKEEGGPVTSGKAYVVGEAGAEAFVSNAAMHSMAGGSDWAGELGRTVSAARTMQSAGVQIVGDGGPELFVAPAAGTIIPHDALTSRRWVGEVQKSVAVARTPDVETASWLSQAAQSADQKRSEVEPLSAVTESHRVILSQAAEGFSKVSPEVTSQRWVAEAEKSATVVPAPDVASTRWLSHAAQSADQQRAEVAPVSTTTESRRAVLSQAAEKLGKVGAWLAESRAPAVQQANRSLGVFAPQVIEGSARPAQQDGMGEWLADLVQSIGRARAAAIPAMAGAGRVVGEDGPEIFVAPSNGTIVPHDDADRYLLNIRKWMGSLGSSIRGARSAGGPVTAGSAYLVGERGAELFVAQSPATKSNEASAGVGNVSLTYSIDARGADADRIMAILPPLLQRTKNETIAAMLDLQRRGRFA